MLGHFALRIAGSHDFALRIAGSHDFALDHVTWRHIIRLAFYRQQLLQLTVYHFTAEIHLQSNKSFATLFLAVYRSQPRPSPQLIFKFLHGL